MPTDDVVACHAVGHDFAAALVTDHDAVEHRTAVCAFFNVESGAIRGGAYTAVYAESEVHDEAACVPLGFLVKFLVRLAGKDFAPFLQLILGLESLHFLIVPGPTSRPYITIAQQLAGFFKFL